MGRRRRASRRGPPARRERADATGGRFDPTILPALVAAGYDRSFELLEERPPRRIDGWRAGEAVEVDEHGGRARIDAGAALDLGGIGKGYAARGRSRRCARLARSAGGARRPRRRSRPLGQASRGRPVADRRRRPTVARRDRAALLLSGGGVATSGRDVRRFGPGRSLHHLIDPATGEPASRARSRSRSSLRTRQKPRPTPPLSPSRALPRRTHHVAANPQISALVVPHVGAPSALGELRSSRRVCS